VKKKPVPKKSKAAGKKGGKPGNQNARKSGLYARNQPKVSPKSEKDAASRRDILDDVIETLYTKFNQLQDIDQICKCANSISIAVTAANGCDRTIAIVSGKLTSLQDSIERLLADEDPNDPSTLE
jgi:hypothetical protein